MAKSKWSTRLKKAASAWKDSKEAYNQQFAGDNLPEDVYVMKVQDAQIKETGKDKKLSILVEYVVLEGEHKGVSVGSFFGLESEWGPVFARQFFGMMETYGIIDAVPEEAEEIESVLEEIKDAEPICKVRVERGNGGRNNANLVSVVEDGESAGDEGEDAIDIDGMDKAELRALVKDNDLDISGWRKMDEDTLREAIREQIGDDGEEGGEEGEGGDEDGGEEGDAIDLDALDKSGMLELIAENEIDPSDLGFKNKVLLKKATEKKLRAALEEYMKEDGEDGGEEGGSDADDELLEQARIFCGTWDVDIADDADLDDVKKAMKECKFPEKELDEDEVALLEGLELTDCIQKPAAKKKVAAKKTIKKGGKKK